MDVGERGQDVPGQRVEIRAEAAGIEERASARDGLRTHVAAARGADRGISQRQIVRELHVIAARGAVRRVGRARPIESRSAHRGGQGVTRVFDFHTFSPDTGKLSPRAHIGLTSENLNPLVLASGFELLT
jgi:hypothetical protein